MSAIILLSGKMGAGKSTLATAIKNHWELTKGNRGMLVNFADALYDMHGFCLGYLKDHGIDTPEKDRVLLQLLGTEWGRKVYGDDVWVNILKKKVEKASDPSRSLGQNQLFIIADCRFPNELKAFPEAHKIRLECNRTVRKYRCSAWSDAREMHESETALDGVYEYDFLLNTEATPVNDLVKTIFKDGLIK